MDDNEIFMEFFEFMNEINAPPYLQFYMNADSFKQFSSLDGCAQEAMLKDAYEIFTSHFAYNARLKIPMDPLIQTEIKNSIENRQVSASLFLPAQDWVLQHLQAEYLHLFDARKPFNKLESSIKPSIPSKLNDDTKFFLPQFAETDTDNFALSVPVADEKFESKSLDSYFISKPCRMQKNYSEPDLRLNWTQGGISDERRIVTAITLLKEQIFVIEDKMARISNSKDRHGLKVLKETQRKLKKELQSMQDLLEHSVDAPLPYDLVGSSVSLSFKKETLMSSLVSSSNPSFLVKVEFAALFVPTLTLLRKWSDFSRLHKSLVKNYPKIAQVAFPSNILFANNQTLLKTLERYLQVLLSDEMICKSRHFIKFFSSQIESNTSVSSLSTLESEKQLRTSKSASQISLMKRAHLTSSTDSSLLKFKEPPAVAISQKPDKKQSKNCSFSDEEVDLLLDSFFAFLLETFDLNENSKWLRRKLLQIAKNLMKQIYNESINDYFAQKLDRFSSETFLSGLLDSLSEQLFPADPSKVPPPRTADQMLATMIEARGMLLKNTPDVLVKAVGRYNVVSGLNRVFSMLQERELNRRLAFVLLDILTKLLFSTPVK